MKECLIFVVLLNFLIALISAKFEDVMSKKLMYLYLHKTMLNEDCLLFMRYCGQLKPLNTLLIYSNDDPMMASDLWEGTTLTIKNYVREKIDAV
jgi:hypothetical protein